MKRLRNILLILSLSTLPMTLFAIGRLGVPLARFPMPMSTAHGIATLGDLTLTGVYPRIFTPNGDGANDKVGFHFDNPEDVAATGEIYSLSGAKVSNLQAGSVDPAEALFWDGKDSDGRVVPSGIYLYQIEYQGHRATGTVIVAR